MKKIFTLAVVLLGVLALSGCSSATDATIELTGLTENESIATMSYLSSGFLNFTEPTVDPVASGSIFLADDEDLVIEEELEEVNQYMEQLKVFMQEGTDNFGRVTETESDLPEYEFKLEFVVQGEVYVIYYNVDAETGDYTGIIIINEVTYELEAAIVEEELEADLDEDELDTDDLDADLDEDEDAELKQKFRLTARNGEDFVTITYKKEIEEGETTLKFSMYEYKNAVEREMEMKISHEDNEMKIKIEQDGNEFTFKRNVEDGETVYKLKYKVRETEGEVKIIETEDEFGEFHYQYQVKEQNKNRNFDMDEPGHHDDDDDEDSQNQNENEHQNGLDEENTEEETDEVL